jgi:hypothetical protein
VILTGEENPAETRVRSIRDKIVEARNYSRGNEASDLAFRHLVDAFEKLLDELEQSLISRLF